VPPPFALALTILLIGYLIRRDYAVEPRPSPAVWIPIVWLLINGSRQVSQWLGVTGPAGFQRFDEGSPVDQAVYGLLIVAGSLVVANRRVRMGQLAKNNWWIILFFLYEGISCVWSDTSSISLRRWIKASGDLVMVLVLCSDSYPSRAITATLKRSGYVLIPLSVLFCKYYPAMGRTFDPWGNQYYTGVTLDKNMFGYILFAYGLLFASVVMHAFRQDWSSHTTARTDVVSHAFLLAITAWITPLVNSKTSLFALIIGIVLVIALQFSAIKRHLWSYLITALVVGATANALFSVKDAILAAAGRDPTLTGRTEFWKVLIAEESSPLVGAGYASFWNGERLQRMWDLYPNSKMIQTHNGYIEHYLQLGLIGIELLGGVLWTGLRNAKRRLLATHYETGILDNRLFQTFGIAYMIAYLAYNWTEATFMGLNFLFIVFLMNAWEFPHTRVPDSFSHTGE
jgi:exopolysaccharide production protein ExoQ